MLSEAQIQHTFELLKIPLSRMKEFSPLYFPCPFEHRHTKRSQPRDCQLYFKDEPAFTASMKAAGKNSPNG